MITTILFRVLAAIIGAIIGCVFYMGIEKLPMKEKLLQIKNWLVYAVTEAESIYGEKMGVIKLEYVYEKFREVFPKLASKITFEKFSELVDEALEKMKKLIETNPKFKEFIEKE